MSDTDREPNVREDPRKQGTGEGYPESNPEGDTPVEGTKQGPEAGTQQEPEMEGQPSSTIAGQDSPPSTATGNPHAAGP
jgi:hypothetical protein